MIEKHCLLGLLDLSPNVMIEPRKQKIITVIIIIHKRRCDFFDFFFRYGSKLTVRIILNRSNFVIRNIFLSCRVSNILKDILDQQRRNNSQRPLFNFWLFISNIWLYPARTEFHFFAIILWWRFWYKVIRYQHLNFLEVSLYSYNAFNLQYELCH